MSASRVLLLVMVLVGCDDAGPPGIVGAPDAARRDAAEIAPDAARRDAAEIAPDAAPAPPDARPSDAVAPRVDAAPMDRDAAPTDAMPADAAPADAAPADAAPADAGPPTPDAVPVEPDATPPELDAARPDLDAAPVEPDAAPVEPDAAPPPPDAAPLEPDGAPPDEDAAPVEPDAAPPPPPDAAPPPPDAAPPPPPPPAPMPLITEILAANQTGLLDEDGDTSDWLELFNPYAVPLSLEGYFLTDEARWPEQWPLPAVVVPPHGYLVVWASGKDRRDGTAELHTNFSLSQDGEYLAVVGPGGERGLPYDPYPVQVDDVSYGIATDHEQRAWIGPGSPARLRSAPPEPGGHWQRPGYDDAAWAETTLGVGNDARPPPTPPRLLADSVADFSGAQGALGWLYGYWDRGADGDGRFDPDRDFVLFPADFGPHSEVNFWNGESWDWFDGDPPFTALGPTGGLPNGARGGGAHAVVRRWVSADDAVIRVRGRVGDADPAGTGARFRLLHEGATLFEADLSGTTRDYTVETPVRVGDRLDWLIDPGPDDDDAGDLGVFTARVEIRGSEIGARGPRVADSVDDWSRSGIQGDQGWTYGYADRSADPDGAYQVDDFVLFPRSGGEHGETDYWDDEVWDWPGDGPPWTRIDQREMRPSGPEDGPMHWPIRRWTSPVDGSLLVVWTLATQAHGGTGTTGHVFHEGQPVDSAAVAGGDPIGVMRSALLHRVRAGDRVDFALDSTGPDGDSDGVSDGSVMTATLYQVPDLVPYIEAEVPAGGAWLRIPFDAGQGPPPQRLRLAVRADDGFVAWLDGLRVAELNAPADVDGAARATADQSPAEAIAPREFDLSPALDQLRPGPNVLAVQALDAEADDQAFLFAPELRAEWVYPSAGDRRYLRRPTPGADNVQEEADLGPLVFDLTANPPVSPGEPVPIVVTALPTVDPVAEVRCIYQVRFGAEAEQPMEPDADGRWVAWLPEEISAPGELLRWRVVAVDTAGRESRWPPFADPLDSEAWYGTVVRDPWIRTALPVVQWFFQEPARINTVAGARGEVFWDGELYGNVQADVHGQSSRGFFKKSYDVDFTRDHRFRLRPDLPRVKDVNLLTNYADKSKVRNTLSYATYAAIGAGHHLAFPVRVHQNGAFWAVYDLVEDPEDHWIERLYGPPVGALYKMYDRMLSVNAGEKKTRKDEDKSDLQALLDGLALEPEARRVFVHDHVNLAAMANFLAGMFLTSDRDCCHKNYYAYRDTDRTGEWQYLPWDVDLTWGRNWTGNYWDDRMYFENPLYIGRGNNRLLDAIYALPEFNEMYLRRVRSAVDQVLQPPDTPREARWVEALVAALVEQMAPDAVEDNAAWPTWGQPQTFAEGVRLLLEEHLQPRRVWIYGTLVQQGGVVREVLVEAGAPIRYRVPLEDDPPDWMAPDFDDAEWQIGALALGYEDDGPGLYAPFIDAEVRPAAEHPEAAAVRVRAEFEVEDPAAVPALALAARYDDGVVVWLNGAEVARRNHPGAPTWLGGADDRQNGAAAAVDPIALPVARLVPGRNVLAVQVSNVRADSGDLLLHAELAAVTAPGGGPLPLAQADDVWVQVVTLERSPERPTEAYAQIHNPQPVAVDLTGWRLVAPGLDHAFEAGTVLPAGGDLYSVADALRFRARAEPPTGGRGLFVQGNWRSAPRGSIGRVLDAEGRVRSR